MKRYGCLIRPYIILSALVFCVLPAVDAVTIDVEMRLNDAGFVSFDHFKAELLMNNRGRMTPDASIFGILEIQGEYFFWPSFTTEVDFRVQDVEAGESTLLFLEFAFPDIDVFIPFGPMVFWGAWFVDAETWNYDYREFWLDHGHKWTPTPTPTPTPTHTPTIAPGDLLATDPIVGNMRFVRTGKSIHGSPVTEPCRRDDEGSQFTHILTKNIAVMETEVSRQMWADLKAVQQTLPNDPSDTVISPTIDHPVQQNTWNESVLFANLLSLKNGFTRCYYTDGRFTIPVTALNYTTGPFYCNFNVDGYRLPTEGEWEYFTRAGASGPFSCDEPGYNSENCNSCSPGTFQVLEQYCVYCANAYDQTEVIGSKLPNPWNLKDVHGNVWEWCWDWYADYPTGPVIDYAGPVSGSYRICRGGGCLDNARTCRAANRGRGAPLTQGLTLGFRLVRTIQVQDMPTSTPTQTPTNTPTNAPTPTNSPTQTPTHLPTKTPIATPGSIYSNDLIVGIMRFVPPGVFTQGSPKKEGCRSSSEKQFTHILTKSIAVMQTEVTRQMWENLKAVQPMLPNDPSDTDISRTIYYPVQQITWYESMLFANLLSLQNDLTRCYYTDVGYTIPVTDSNYTTGPFYCNFNADGYRLPTEGEREYFTRAGTSGPFSCDEPEYHANSCVSCTAGYHYTLEKYSVFCYCDPARARPAGTRLPNPWNLRDVHGNVKEWCWDLYADDYPMGTAIDYTGSYFGVTRARRDGSWKHGPNFVRSAFRSGQDPSYRSDELGFRLVRTISL